ncbi:PilZ domain-containing protein [Magnetococcus sp. PR-3]|uniref:PilZ domain-containing protein n=1 Tax=Magnetococcus sp. PR-3 TaxID=3120355 RepID=UPI002FCE4BF1
MTDKPLITDARREIVKLITSAVLADSSLKIQLDKQKTDYYSLLRVNANSLEALQAGDYMGIAPLDPAMGNAKIRQAETIFIQFFTSDFCAEATTQFQSIGKDKTLLLDVPTQLTLTDQKRSDVRVEVDEKWRIKLKVIRPSGLSFLATVKDISAGGLSFQSVGSIPYISEKARVRLVLLWKDEAIDLRTNSVMLKDLEKGGERFLRARFLPESQKTAVQIENLVALLQRKHIEQRRDLFDD